LGFIIPPLGQAKREFRDPTVAVFENNPAVLEDVTVRRFGLARVDEVHRGKPFESLLRVTAYRRQAGRQGIDGL